MWCACSTSSACMGCGPMTPGEAIAGSKGRTRGPSRTVPGRGWQTLGRHPAHGAARAVAWTPQGHTPHRGGRRPIGRDGRGRGGDTGRRVWSDHRDVSDPAASVTFEPCYMGGWSALEHWGLTEQLFRTVMVFTARRVRNRNPDFQGTSIHLKVVAPDKLFGTRPV